MRWNIRKAQASDWSRIREICWQTSSLGSAMPPWRREVFSEVWIGPYEAELPNWTWVATFADATHSPVAGYITVAPDTRALHKTWAWRLRPSACRAALKTWRDSPFSLEKFLPTDLTRHFRRSFGWETGPESALGIDFLQNLFNSYPAHLHINLSPEHQGQGGGTPLLQTALEALRHAGIPGAHLFCGDAPLKFYERNGFLVLNQTTWGQKRSPVYCLARKLE
jgi:GNAT superfamily N-acetyltransferase